MCGTSSQVSPGVTTTPTIEVAVTRHPRPSPVRAPLLTIAMYVKTNIGASTRRLRTEGS